MIFDNFKDLLMFFFRNVLLASFVIFVIEVFTSELLKQGEQTKPRPILKTIRRILISVVVNLISLFFVFSFVLFYEINYSKEPASIFTPVLIISILSYVLYRFYLRTHTQEILHNIELTLQSAVVKFFNRRKESISEIKSQLNAKREQASAILDSKNEYASYEYTSMSERNNSLQENELKLIVVYFDSIVLIMTALGLLLTAPLISPLLDESKTTLDPYKTFVFIMLFISIIIAKIHANHEKETKSILKK